MECGSVELGEALVEHDDVSILEERAGQVEPTSLAVRELPARLTHDLEKATGHPCHQLAESQLVTQSFRVLQVLRRRGPPAAHASRR